MAAPNRSERLTTRFRPHQRQKLEKAAERARCNLSELIRAGALERAERVLGEDEDDG